MSTSLYAQTDTKPSGEEHYISLTTNKGIGEEISLFLSGEKPSSKIEIEGAKPGEGGLSYIITNSNIKITGEVKTILLSECGLTHIDITHAPQLGTLIAGTNELRELKIPQGSQLNTLLLSSNSLLKEIDFTNGVLIERLFLEDCGFSSLNLEPLKKLVVLECSGNNLEQIDLKNHSQLQQVIVANNNLSTLDVSSNKGLTQIDISGNKFTQFTLPSLEKLNRLKIFGNQIALSEMRSIIASLPQRTKGDKASIFVIDTKRQPKDANICTAEEVKSAHDKNWEVYDYKGGANEGEGWSTKEVKPPTFPLLLMSLSCTPIQLIIL